MKLTTIQVTTELHLRHDNDLDPVVLADVMAFTGGTQPTNEKLLDYIEATVDGDEEDVRRGEYVEANFRRIKETLYRGGTSAAKVLGSADVIGDYGDISEDQSPEAIAEQVEAADRRAAQDDPRGERDR